MIKIFLLTVALVFSAWAEEGIIKVKTQSSIELGKTESVKARFLSMGEGSQEARNAVFVGGVAYKKNSNGSTSVLVKWMGVQNGQKSAVLEKPFLTKLTARDKIPTGSELSARGDTVQLTRALRNMKEGKPDEKPKMELSSDEQSDGWETAGNLALNAASDLTDSAISGWATGSSSTSPTDSSYSTTPATTTPTTTTPTTYTTTTPTTTTPTTSDESDSTASTESATDSTTPTTTTTTEEDGTIVETTTNPDGSTTTTTTEPDGTVTTVTTDSSGKVTCSPIIDHTAATYQPATYVSGECVGTGPVSTIFETTDGCPQRIDWDNQVVNIVTRTYAMPGGSEIAITPCKVNGKTAPLKKTHNGCQWVEDLDTNTANLQERYYFTFQSEPVNLTACVNSDVTSEIDNVDGDLGCAPIIDLDAKTYQETASNKGLCEPVGLTYKLYDAYDVCEPFPDFENNTVTLSKILYIMPDSGGVRYVGGCEKTDKVVPMKETVDGCGVRMNKDDQTAVQQVRKYYDLNGDKKFVTSCIDGEASPLVTFKEYNQECKNIVDLDSGFVTPAFRTMTQIEGKTLEVKGCEYETDKQIPIDTTPETCGVRVDKKNVLAIQQERKYYTWEGTKEFVSECFDATSEPLTTYKEWNKQCQNLVDYDNLTVTPAFRTMAMVNGSELEVKGCEYDTNNTKPIYTTKEDCQQIVDKDRQVLVEQNRQYYEWQGGRNYLTECTISDKTEPLATYREYDGICKNLIDLENSLVTPAFRTMATVNGSEIEVKGCEFESNNTIEIKTTKVGCDRRDDFLDGKTYERERKYYTWEGNPRYITECTDSDKYYPHYLTTTGCENEYVAGTVIPYKQTVYNLDDGTIGFTNGCKPISGNIPVYKEFCGYEHNFNTGQSYRQYKDYYLDPSTGETKYLTSCVADDLNFPHKKASCSPEWAHNDTLLQSTHKEKIYFYDTVAKKNIYPNGDECTDGSIVAYANKGTYDRVKTNIGTVEEVSSDTGNLKYVGGVWFYKGNVLDTSLASPSAGSLSTINTNILIPPVASSSNCTYNGISGKRADWLLTTECQDYGLFGGKVSTEGDQNYIDAPKCTDGNVWFSYVSGGLGQIGFPAAYRYCEIFGPKAKIAIMKREVDYVRPDGSTYSKELSTWYQVQP